VEKVDEDGGGDGLCGEGGGGGGWAAAEGATAAEDRGGREGRGNSCFSSALCLLRFRSLLKRKSATDSFSVALSTSCPMDVATVNLGRLSTASRNETR